MKRKERITAKLDKEVDDFNSKYAVGDAVKLRLDDGSILETKTKGPACILSGHTAVGYFEGIIGGYLLERVVKN